MEPKNLVNKIISVVVLFLCGTYTISFNNSNFCFKVWIFHFKNRKVGKHRIMMSLKEFCSIKPHSKKQPMGKYKLEPLPKSIFESPDESFSNSVDSSSDKISY